MADGEINISGTQPLEEFLQVFSQLRGTLASTKNEFEATAGSALSRLENAVNSARERVHDARYALNQPDQDEDDSYLRQELDDAEACLRELEWQAENVSEALRRYRVAAREFDRLREERIPKAINFLEYRIQAIREYKNITFDGTKMHESGNYKSVVEIEDPYSHMHLDAAIAQDIQKVAYNSYILYTDNVPLFRGDGRSSEIVFREGFQPKGVSGDLEQYVKANSPSQFVGASRSEDTAWVFARRHGGYVYEIDPQSVKGYDVVASIPESVHNWEQEVAIVGGIPRTAIKNARIALANGTLGPKLANPFYIP